METKFNIHEEVYYADFAGMKLQKSKVVGMILQRESDLPMVYYLENALTIDENNLFKTIDEGKKYLLTLLEAFKTNLEAQGEE